jgi:competence protein ComEA
MFNARHLMACALLVVAGVVHAAEPVNINTADAETLASAINGVGLKKAREIIAYRQQNGPFATVDDLSKVNGIGTHTVESSRENLTVQSKGD